MKSTFEEFGSVGVRLKPEPFCKLYETNEGEVFCVQTLCEHFNVDYLAERDRILEGDFTAYGNAAARIFLPYKGFLEYVLSIPLELVTEVDNTSLKEYQYDLASH